MIAIIDYNMGNIASVAKALLSVGAEVMVTQDSEDLKRAHGLVLPGVGAFGSAMENLQSLGLIEVLKEQLKVGKPFLGICLGLQVLFEKSAESPGISGLGILAGQVKQFSFAPEQKLKVPHMGWNQLKITKQDSLFQGIPEQEVFYFVHSFYAEPIYPKVISGQTSYGIEFTSAIVQDNIRAVQFHPEKSSKMGLQLLKNFVGICKGFYEVEI